MDRADWLRITAAFGLALVTSESATADLRTMLFSTRDAWVESTATDTHGVNLDPMKADAILMLPYVEGTREPARRARVVAAPLPLDSTTQQGGSMRFRPNATPAPTYSRALRGTKRYTS